MAHGGSNPPFRTNRLRSPSTTPPPVPRQPTTASEAVVLAARPLCPGRPAPPSRAHPWHRRIATTCKSACFPHLRDRPPPSPSPRLPAPVRPGPPQCAPPPPAPAPAPAPCQRRSGRVRLKRYRPRQRERREKTVQARDDRGAFAFCRPGCPAGWLAGSQRRTRASPSRSPMTPRRAAWPQPPAQSWARRPSQGRSQRPCACPSGSCRPRRSQR